MQFLALKSDLPELFISSAPNLQKQRSGEDKREAIRAEGHISQYVRLNFKVARSDCIFVEIHGLLFSL